MQKYKRRAGNKNHGFWISIFIKKFSSTSLDFIAGLSFCPPSLFLIFIFLLFLINFSSLQNLPELLNFLFQLSFLTFGKDYAMSSLTDSQKEFVDLLMELGLIFKPKVFISSIPFLLHS